MCLLAFILFKKTDFNTILACLGGKVYRWLGGHKIFVAEIGGVAIFWRRLFVNLGSPPSEENDSPLGMSKYIMRTECLIDMKQMALESEFHKLSLYAKKKKKKKKKKKLALPSSASGGGGG